MGFNINRATLLGNATKPAELKYTPNGNAVCTFTLATNHGVKDKATDQWNDVPTFHRIVVWGKLAEYANREIAKGTKVIIEGRIDNRSYKDKDGTDKYISEVVADTAIAFRTVPGTPRPEQDAGQEQPPTEAEKVFAPGGEPYEPTAKPVTKTPEQEDEDSIPF